MDVAKEVEVSVEVYEILRKCYKEQSRGDEKIIVEKSNRAKKKKKKDSDASDSLILNEKYTSPEKSKKKKREKVGLHDSIVYLDANKETDRYDSFPESKDHNDTDGDKFNGHSDSFHSSSISKKKNEQKFKTDLIDDGKRRDSMKGASFRNKSKEANRDEENRKSRKKLVENEVDKTLPISSSKRGLKSSKGSESVSLLATPKPRKGTASGTTIPKTPKTVDITTQAVKKPKSSKNKIRSTTTSPPDRVAEKRSSKTLKSSSKKEKKEKSKIGVDSAL
jgi:hypothetical protein